MSPMAVVAEPTGAIVANDAPVEAIVAPRATLQCAVAEQEHRITEDLLEAESALDGDDWRWMRELVEAMHDDTTKIQSKLYFLRLLRASDVEMMDAVLSDMEAWRESAEGKTAKGRNVVGKEERDGVQALFLLGIDKQMSLNRYP